MVRFEQLINTWDIVSPFLSVPTNDEELDKLINLSHYLMDTIGENERHPLNSLLDTIGTLIAEYEKSYILEPEGDPIECLKFLMEEHGLRQKDLAEIGSPGVISEILNGKRQLNKRHIIALSKKFNCSPAIFI